MATAERRDLLEFLGGLSDAQWDAPTLCDGWAVRDVVAHTISYEESGAAGLAKQVVQGRFRLSKINAMGVARLRDAPPHALREALERHLRPSGLTTAFGGRIALLDGLVHHQDIRRALGLPRVIPPERLRVALDFALFAPPIRGAWRVRGTRVAATDLDWAFGAGPDACGSGEAVLMVMAGRRGVAEDLSGPGAQRLRARLH
ncbi:MAG TPA: maleylpyruvate isomerase family mycothiol-dependent enzyme [Mycobacteriales bacterium]|nr:maleylpyruvate isomerase family mycothiol-dependent enzyme [Mycobacteriales bacterium]